MESFWPRFNTLLLFMVLVAILGLFTTRAFGGPLDPPGAPGPSDGVLEPGTPISSLPFTITQPGYYYITRNLTAIAAGQDGISVGASNVTLDLHGFTLTGFDRTGTGISAPGDGVVIRDGMITGWDTALDANFAHGGLIEDVVVRGSVVGIRAGESLIVQDCVVDQNEHGVFLFTATLRGCTISNNSKGGVTTSTSSLIEHNKFFQNGTFLGETILLNGNSNTVQDNVETEFTTPSNPFIRIPAGVGYDIILRNRYPCSPGIVDGGGGDYIAAGQNNFGDVNYCFPI